MKQIQWTEASQARIMGKHGLKCTKTCDDNNNFFETLKVSHSFFPHVQVENLCNNEYNGASAFGKFCKNLEQCNKKPKYDFTVD